MTTPVVRPMFSQACLDFLRQAIALACDTAGIELQPMHWNNTKHPVDQTIEAYYRFGPQLCNLDYPGSGEIEHFWAGVRFVFSAEGGIVKLHFCPAHLSPAQVGSFETPTVNITKMEEMVGEYPRRWAFFIGGAFLAAIETEEMILKNMLPK